MNKHNPDNQLAKSFIYDSLNLLLNNTINLELIIDLKNQNLLLDYALLLNWLQSNSTVLENPNGVLLKHMYNKYTDFFKQININPLGKNVFFTALKKIWHIKFVKHTYLGVKIYAKSA